VFVVDQPFVSYPGSPGLCHGGVRPLAPDIYDDEVAFWNVVVNDYQAATLRWPIQTGQSIRSWIGF